MNAQITFLPERKTIDVRTGTTVLAASRKAKASVRTRCGGNAACLMCKIIVEDGSGLSPANDNEKRKLGYLLGQGYRLSCQARVIGDVIVTIPEDPLKSAVRALLQKQKEEDDWL